MKRRIFSYPTLAACITFSTVAIAAAEPLPILTAALQGNFGDRTVAWHENAIGKPSPNGRFLAYDQCVFHENDPSRNGIFPGGAVGCTLLIADVRSGSIVHSFQPETFNGTWSPDGAALAFSCPNANRMSLCTWSSRNQKLVHFPRVALDLVSTIRWISNADFVVDGANALLPGELPRTVYPIVAERMTTPVVYRTKENRAADPRRDKYEVSPVSPGILAQHGPRTIYAANVNGGLRVLTTIENTPTGNANIDGVPNSPYLSIAETSGEFSELTMRSTNGGVRIIDARNGATVRTFTKLLQNRAQIASSPDGMSVAWCAQPAKAQGLEIFKAGVKDGSLRVVSHIPTTSPPPTGGIVWSAGGRQIFTLLRAPGATSAFARNVLWVTNIATGRSQLLFSNTDERIVKLIPIAQNPSAAWAPAHSNAIILATQNLSNLKYSLVRIDLGTRTAKTLLSEDAVYDGFGGDEQGANMYFLRQKVDLAPDIYAFNPAADTSPRAMTHLMDGFRHWPLGKSRLLSYTTSRGVALHAAILLPPGYRAGTRLPTVVYLYGGLYNSQRLNDFGLGEYDAGLEDLQVLATRGIAVLVPDLVYSGNDLMEEDLSEATAAMDTAIARGYSDPNRFGVMGHSHGGYDAYALMAESTRFKAGVVRAGIADWVDYGTELDRPLSRTTPTLGNAKASSAMPRYGLGADIWTNPNRYLTESPLFRLNHVAGAVLIIHAAGDDNVYAQNAEQAFSALLQLNKNAELALYPAGNHTEDMWPMKYQIDYVNRMVDWFQRYLR